MTMTRTHAVDSKKLEYGPGTNYAGFPASPNFGVGGLAYLNFLASTVRPARSYSAAYVAQLVLRLVPMPVASDCCPWNFAQPGSTRCLYAAQSPCPTGECNMLSTSSLEATLHTEASKHVG